MHLTVSLNYTTLINSRPHKSSSKIKHTTWARILLQTKKKKIVSYFLEMGLQTETNILYTRYAPNHALTSETYIPWDFLHMCQTNVPYLFLHMRLQIETVILNDILHMFLHM
jgi:hypothetical protein